MMYWIVALLAMCGMMFTGYSAFNHSDGRTRMSLFKMGCAFACHILALYLAYTAGGAG